MRRTPIEVKFRQLASLMASVKTMGWEDDLADGEEAVRLRWQRLREAWARGQRRG